MAAQNRRTLASHPTAHTSTTLAKQVSERRAKRLGQARADLTQLPGMLDELSRCLTERGAPGGGKPSKVSGSPAPLRLDVLHLVDDRRKPGWDGEDPRLRQLEDRYGATATLETWTRVVCEEMAEPPDMAEVASVRSEASVLLEVWPWIEDQDWAEELADDVTHLTARVRAALGIRSEYRPRCRYCRSAVVPVEAQTHTITTWEACAFGLCSGCKAEYPKGPALDALGQVQDPLPLKDVAEITGISIKTLYRWQEAGDIKAETDRKKGNLFDLAAVRAVATRIYGRQAIG